MKNLTVLIIILVLFNGCSDGFDKHKSEFPECIGTVESFNPTNIAESFNGRIWNQDTTMITSFTFTDYKELNWSYLSRSWSLWIKFKVNSSTKYQSFDCFKLHEPDIWYAWSGMDFKDKYSTWDLYFETFNCSEISGTCNVIFPAENDTINFNFEGSR